MNDTNSEKAKERAYQKRLKLCADYINGLTGTTHICQGSNKYHRTLEKKLALEDKYDGSWNVSDEYINEKDIF